MRFRQFVKSAIFAATLIYASPSNAQTQATVPTQAAAQTQQAAVQQEQPRTVTVQVTRNGVIRPLEIIVDGDRYQLNAQRSPSFALVMGAYPIVVTSGDSVRISGNFRSFSGARTSDVVVRPGEGYPKGKAVYLDGNTLDSKELSDLLGPNNYVAFNLDALSRSQPGESLKLPFIIVPNTANLRKTIDELGQYQTKLSEAESTIKSLREQADKGEGSIKGLEDKNQLESERQQYDTKLKELENLNKQYSDRLDKLLSELSSEKFLLFAHYGLGNLTNKFGQGLSAEFPTNQYSVNGVFNSNKFFFDLLANLESAEGNIFKNNQTAGNMGLTRNFFRANGQYSAYRKGKGTAGVSVIWAYDKITQRGYLLDPRNPNDPSKRIPIAGNGNIAELLAGGFAAYDDGNNRVALSVGYGTSYGNSGGRGNELNFSVSGLADTKYLIVSGRADVTRFSGMEGYYPNPSNPSQLSGTDIRARVSAAFTKGIKGFRPSVSAEIDKMGPNHNPAFMAGFGKTFGKKIANDAQYK